MQQCWCCHHRSIPPPPKEKVVITRATPINLCDDGIGGKLQLSGNTTTATLAGWLSEGSSDLPKSNNQLDVMVAAASASKAGLATV